MGRPVKYWEWEQPEGSPGQPWKRTFKGEAIFHEFGVDYEEFEEGPGNFSTAIIELPDGTVKNIPAIDIQFTDKETK